MELAVVVILAGLGGVAVLVRAWNSDARRTRRVLRRARVVPIAELVDGQLACIVGHVEADASPITSMMAQRACVAFDTTTTTFTGDVSVSTTTTRRAVPFFVVDDTGRARVDAPQVALCNEPVAGTDRFAERILEVGARVRLVGSVSLDPERTSGEAAYREGSFKATIVGTAKYPLLADTDD